MSPKNKDVIIAVIGVTVLIMGAIVYFLINSGVIRNNGNKLEFNEITVGKNDGINVYQFLLDTKDVYCDITELQNYFVDLGTEFIGKQLTIDDMRIMSKKVLMKNEIMGLNNIVDNYTNSYSGAYFPQTVNLINLLYEYRINEFNYLSNVENKKDDNYENSYVLLDAVSETQSTLYDSLKKEYISIRGEYEELWPEDEAKLLDLKAQCPQKTIK